MFDDDVLDPAVPDDRTLPLAAAVLPLTALLLDFISSKA